MIIGTHSYLVFKLTRGRANIVRATAVDAFDADDDDSGGDSAAAMMASSTAAFDVVLMLMGWTLFVLRM